MDAPVTLSLISVFSRFFINSAKVSLIFGGLESLKKYFNAARLTNYLFIHARVTLKKYFAKAEKPQKSFFSRGRRNGKVCDESFLSFSFWWIILHLFSIVTAGMRFEEFAQKLWERNSCKLALATVPPFNLPDSAISLWSVPCWKLVIFPYFRIKRRPFFLPSWKHSRVIKNALKKFLANIRSPAELPPTRKFPLCWHFYFLARNYEERQKIYSQ